MVSDIIRGFFVFRASTLSPGSGHMVQLQKKVRSLEDENLTLKLEVRKTIAFTVQSLYNTVNLEIFARILFSHNLAYANTSFMKIKPFRICKITLSFTDICK